MEPLEESLRVIFVDRVFILALQCGKTKFERWGVLLRHCVRCYWIVCRGTATSRMPCERTSGGRRALITKLVLSLAAVWKTLHAVAASPCLSFVDVEH